MMVLLANLLIEPTNPYASSDEMFSARAIQLFDKVVEFIPDPEKYVDIRFVIGELYGRAVRAMNEAKSLSGEAAVDALQSTLLSYDGMNEDPWGWATALPGKMNIFPDIRHGDGTSLEVFP